MLELGDPAAILGSVGALKDCGEQKLRFGANPSHSNHNETTKNKPRQTKDMEHKTQHRAKHG